MPMAAAEIGHPHQLRNHAHDVAATAAAEHAHEVAAAHAHAVTFRRKRCAAATKTPGDSPPAHPPAEAAAAHHATKTAATAFHHLAHHRSHGLHQHAEAALAHL